MKLFKKHGSKIIKYESFLDIEPQFLKPAKIKIPEWYKKDTRLTNNIKAFKDKSVKHCVPVLDAITAGYVVTTPFDIYVTQVDGSARFEWGQGMPRMIDARPSTVAYTLPTPTGYDNQHYVWKIFGAFELPKGYSALVTHPFNHLELPFYTLTGIVDDYVFGSGLLPFFLAEGFEGLIPKGTPIFHVLPFKREDWTAEETKGVWDAAEKNIRLSNAHMSGWYKRYHWKKKSYN